MKSPLSIDRESNQFRVIKVGGSLFNMPDLKQRVVDWSEAIADRRCLNVWVCGGGALVDEVRNWQTLHGLDDEAAHRISIALMSQTAELFQSLFLSWPLLADINQLNNVNVTSVSNVVFDCQQWALNCKDIDRSWDTTSDTISLRLAVALRASHLFLLKSESPKSNKVTDAIEDGLVDRAFATGQWEGPDMTVSVVNLRESNDAFELVW